MLGPDAGSALPAIIERLDRSEGPALDAVLEEARGVLDLLPQERSPHPVDIHHRLLYLDLGPEKTRRTLTHHQRKGHVLPSRSVVVSE